MLKLGERKRIGNGTNTNFWKDPWIENITLSTYEDLNPLKRSLHRICGKNMSDYIIWEGEEPKWKEFYALLRRNNLCGQRQVN